MRDTDYYVYADRGIGGMCLQDEVENKRQRLEQNGETVQVMTMAGTGWNEMTSNRDLIST